MEKGPFRVEEEGEEEELLVPESALGVVDQAVRKTPFRLKT